MMMRRRERERERQREENKREITIALRHNRFVSIELSSFCSSTVRWSRIYPLETVKNHFISSNVYRSSIESEKCHLRETFNFPLLEFVQKLTRALLSCYLILKILTLCKIFECLCEQEQSNNFFFRFDYAKLTLKLLSCF